MLIYTQPGNCSQCGEQLVESTTNIPGQNPLSVYICQTCEAGINASRVMIHNDSTWMFDEFPEDQSTWDCCITEFEKTKRRANLWGDLKHVLKTGTWSDTATIQSILDNMEWMENPSTKQTEEGNNEQ